MENDNELDLGLGLLCGASSSKSTAKTDAAPNIHHGDSDKNRKTVDGFNGFRHEGEHSNSMNNELSRPPEKFFDILSSDGNKLTEVEENLLDARNKRKSIFEDLNYQKKHECDAHISSLYDMEKPSHISITTTDEGSAAENEDVADSAGNDSMLRFAADHNRRSTQQSDGGASSGVQKHSHVCTNPVAGQIGFNILPEKGPEMWNNIYNVHHGINPPNMNFVPLSSFSKESDGVTIAGTSSNSLLNIIQHVTPGMALGYAPFQSQQLGKDHPWGILPRPQQLYPPYAVRPTGGIITNSENHSNSLKLPLGSEPAHHFNTLESSMQDGRETQSAEGMSTMSSTIRPGIAADVKFDGTGSYPDLPWVSTKGSGPNGKTISGVTYRFSPNQIKIVCACHGSHMTPEDFVKHANEENKDRSDTSADVPSSPAEARN